MSIGFAKLHPCNNQGYYNYIDIYLPIFIPLSRRKTWRNYVRIAAHVFLRVAVTEYACAKPIVCRGIGQRHNGQKRHNARQTSSICFFAISSSAQSARQINNARHARKTATAFPPRAKRLRFFAVCVGNFTKNLIILPKKIVYLIDFIADLLYTK